MTDSHLNDAEQPNEEIVQLNGRIVTVKQQISGKESELGYLRTEYSKPERSSHMTKQ